MILSLFRFKTIFMKTIGIFIGSLRKDSFNKKIAEKFIEIAQDQFNFEIIDIGNLPWYNADLETDNPPAEWVDFRKKVSKLHGVLFFTPEYNRSIPGALKNAIDVGSRPPVNNVWANKPGGVITASTGRLSAFGANHVLRQSMVFLNVPMLQQPEAYIGNMAEIFDNNGNLDERTTLFLKKFAEAYAKWVHILNP